MKAPHRRRLTTKVEMGVPIDRGLTHLIDSFQPFLAFRIVEMGVPIDRGLTRLDLSSIYRLAGDR